MKQNLMIVLVVLALLMAAGCGSAQPADEASEPLATLPEPTEEGASETSPTMTNQADENQEPQDPEEAEMELTSSEFNDGDAIPGRYSCDGEDISPPLAWSAVPEGTAAFALIMDDPDAPAGTWDHWLLFNIPGDKRSLDPAIPGQDELQDGSRHGENSWGNLEYGGPCPPSGTHRYVFHFYALDQELDLEPGVSKSDLRSAMEGHILAQTELVGTFSR